MVTVGIDPHKHVHVAVAVDAAGRQIGKPLTVKNGPHMIVALLTWIRSISDDTPVTWAIEDGRGFARRLADGLLLAGQEVVWVPTRLMMAHRKLHAATGAKSDPRRCRGGGLCCDRDSGAGQTPHRRAGP